MKTRSRRVRQVSINAAGSQRRRQTPVTEIVDRRASSALQRHLIQRVADSSMMALQLGMMEQTGAGPVQRLEDEEELMQGKFPHQLQSGPEEEELLQGKFSKQLQGGLEEEELMQGKFDGPLQRQELEEEEMLQGKFSEPVQRDQEASFNQTGMPDNLKQGLESLSGMDMSDIRVHYGSPRPAQLNAHAYAQGSDIHLGPGQEQHLPYEAWHAVQQQQGRVQPTTEMGGEKINDDPALEREADVMGEEARRFGK